MLQKIVFVGFGLICHAGAWLIMGYIAIRTPSLITKQMRMDSYTVCVVSLIVILLLSIGTLFLHGMLNRKAVFRFFIINIFVAYCILGGYILFMVPHSINMSPQFIPFLKIYDAIYEIMSIGELGKSAVIYILYNIFICVPLGIFSYYFFPRLRIFKYYFIVTSLMIICVHTLQYFLSINAIIIDDIILSIFGATLIFYCLDKFRHISSMKENNPT
jgi:glycopeptide antibiotics resistance protein